MKVRMPFADVVVILALAALAILLLNMVSCAWPADGNARVTRDVGEATLCR